MPAVRKKQSRKSPTSRPTSPVVPVSRAIRPLTKILLFVRAGGRCEFDTCNKYLLEHHVTLREGNFAQFAHIVAFREDGPRGREGPRPDYINDVTNLMLLCPECHKIIDDNPSDYSRRTLEEYKNQHESRIRHLTSLGPNQKTSILILKANIGRHSVAVPFDHITEAVAPRYPLSRQGNTIDLTSVNDSPSFTDAATATIEQRVRHLYDEGSEVLQSGHISVFALGPIPLLIFLGSKLSSKVSVSLFQKHRDTENWTWKSGGEPIDYEFQKLRTGTNKENVALVLSLSGTIPEMSLPQHIDQSFFVYEIAPRNAVPSVNLLRLEKDLENFKTIYQQALATFLRDHGLIREIHLFPAVPAPVAVLCGREPLPKVHPSLVVYDYDKESKGFTLALRIN